LGYYKADIIVFSYDRPLQLYALLESLEFYGKNIGTTQVIYRTSSPAFTCAYEQVKKRFNSVIFIAQGKNPQADFRPITLRCLEKSPHEYFLFATDDDLVKDYIDFHDCVDALKKTGAYGFYLRFGKNITEHYMHNISVPLPPHKLFANDIYYWRLEDGKEHWRYPHTVDMTIYSKKDVLPVLRNLYFVSPNTLEAYWSGSGPQHFHKFGLFYELSKIVNIPLNLVQTINPHNRHMRFMSTQQLLTIFNQGKKMDIFPLFKIANKAPHIEYVPRFIDR
jgi:hypothetical protein